MNEQALLRMLEREVHDRVAGSSRRRHDDRRAIRGIPAPTRTERKVY